MNYRNRDLLDLAYQLDCTLRVHGVCVGGPGEPCHSNLARHGKGKSIKAHDCFFAPGCRPCHQWLDQGRASREEKAEVFQRGYERAQVELWNRGLLSVRPTGQSSTTTGRKAAQPRSGGQARAYVIPSKIYRKPEAA